MRNLLGKLFGITKTSILGRVIELNTTHNIACSVSYLPLVSASQKEVDETYAIYYTVINDLAQINNTQTNDITIKLYQFGQYLLNKDVFLKKILQLFVYAKERNIFVWIDTSDRTYHASRHIIEETISIYKYLLDNGFSAEDIGLCISSNIRSYPELLEDLLDKNTSSIRLVKGFYNNYDISSRKEVTQNYLQVAELLRHAHTKKIAFATHDHLIIEHLIKAYSHLPKRSQVELQSFIDVHNDYIYALAEKHVIRVYIPFGKTGAFLVRGWPWFDKIRARQRVVGWPTYDTTGITSSN